MINAILAKKIKMTQTFEGNNRTPVTIVNAGPCVVTYIKNNEKDGYSALQLGFETKKQKNTSKSLQGHITKNKDSKLDEKTFPRYLMEVESNTDETLKIGDVVTLSDIFMPGDIISVTGVSKGKGFQGGVKRHGFGGGSKTHGQSDRPRSPGSIGQGTTPGRVYKGKRMAGHMGAVSVTVKNLKVVSVNRDTNELWINGPVPGSNGSLLLVKRTSENKVTKEATNESQSETKE